MKRRGLSDKEVEDSIKLLPRVKDDRNPREIYQNVSLQLKKKRKKSWIAPTFAAAAAVALVMMLVSPGIFESEREKEIALEQAQNTRSSGTDGQSADAPDKHKSAKTGKDDQSQLKIALSDEGDKAALENAATSLYPEEVGNGEPITIWLPEQNVNYMIPFTMAVPKEKGENWLDLLQSAIAALQESDPALLAGFPSSAKLSLEGSDTLVVNVPADHHYGDGSAAEASFLNSIKQSVSSNSNVKKIIFETAGEPGIVLGNFGELTEEPVVKLEHRAYMLVFQKGYEVPYMVPSDKQYDNIEDALAAMKNGIEDEKLLPSLDPSFIIGNVEEKGGVLHLSLAADAEIKNDIPTLYSYEALLLTAKEFGFKAVKLENAPIEKLGPFNLKIENNVPDGPNKKEIAK